MENVRGQLSDIRRSRTVAVTVQDAPAASTSGESRGGIGVMGNGLGVSFPLLPTQDSSRPRPQPPQCFASCHGTLGAGGARLRLMMWPCHARRGVKGNPPSTVVNSSLEVPDQDLMSDARIILAVRVQVRRLQGGGYQAPSALLMHPRQREDLRVLENMI